MDASPTMEIEGIDLLGRMELQLTEIEGIDSWEDISD